MTLTDYLADYRTKFPKAAGIPDADLVQMVSVKSDFNPAWLQQPVEAAPVAAPASVEQGGAFERFVSSPAASVLSGFEGIASGLDTVAQIASRQQGFTPVKSTFELPGRALAAGEALISGRDVGDFWAPVDTKAAIDEMKSSQYQQALTERAQAMDKAGSIFGSEGLGQAWAGIKETVTSPDLILDMVAAQLPQLAAMVATGGGTKVVTAVGAGLQGASSAADRLSEDAAKLKAMTPEQALAVPAVKSLVDEGSSLEDAKAAVMLNAATMTLGLSTVGSLLATRLTGGQLEKLIGRLASGVPVKAVGTLGGAAAKEFTQEAAEEATGQMASNIGAQQISPETELMKGVLAAAGLGGVGGAIIGGGLHGLTGGEAAPATPAATPAAKPAAPAYSYGDIIAPSEGQNYFIALATIDGKEAQFMGETQAAAEARRDEAVAKLAPPAEAAPVETPDQIVRKGLMVSGLKADQIAQLTSEQAEQLFNNIALEAPEITDVSNAEAVERRSEALANAMVNLVAAKQTEFGVQAQQAAQQAELAKAQAKSQAELDSIAAKSQAEQAKLQAQSAQWQAKAAEAAAKLEEFKVRAVQAQTERAAVKIKGKGIVVGPEKNMADQNAVPLGQAPAAVVDPSLPKVDLNVAAAVAGPVAAGPVAAGPAVAGPAVEVKKEEPVAAKPFVAPKQTIAPSTKVGIPPVYYPEVGSDPLVPKGFANKKNTWFAAVLADAQGNQIAVPVIKVGEKPTLRVYLDSRGVKEALGNIIGGNLTRNVEATAAKAAEVGYPLDNKITLEEFAASRGLTFLNAFIRSETPLKAGEHALPPGLVVSAPVAAPALTQAPADKVETTPLVETPTPVADTKRKLSEAELVLMYLRREVGGDLDKLAAALFTKTGVAVDPIEFFTKLNVGKDVPTVIREAAKNGPLAFDLLTSLRRSFASDQAMSYDDSSFAAPTAEDVVVTLNEIIETGLTVTEDKGSGAAGKDDKPVAPKRADKAPSAKAGIARLTATDLLKAEPEFPHSLAANDAAFVAFSAGDYTRAAWAYRQAAALVLEERGGDGSKRAILFHRYADKALVETARVYKASNRKFEVPNYLKQAVIEETQAAPEETRYDLDEDTITGLINSLSIGAFTRVTEGKGVFTTFNPPDADAVAAALTRAENSKSVKSQTWAKAVRESGMTAAEVAERFALAAERATDPESRSPDPVLLATHFSALVTGPRKAPAEIAQTNRPLTPNETAELNNFRTEADTISLLRDLAAQGVNTSFTALSNALAGRFTAGHVAVFADNATRASLSTFSVALHEAAHHFTSKLPPAARLALQRSVAQLSARISGTAGIDPRVGYKSYAEYLASKPEQVLSPEAWAEEVIAEAAALNGISAPVARTLWAGIMRQFKLLALRVNMYLQEQFLGPDGVNPEFAQKWVDTQLQASIAGDHLRLMSLLDRYAKIRPTLGKMVINQLDEHHHWQSTQMNPVTGELSYLGSLENTSSATESRIYQTVAAFKQQAMQNGSWHRAENEAALAGIVGLDKSPVNPTVKLATILLAKATEKAETEIASHAELLKPFMAAWAKVKSIMPEMSEHSRALNKRLGLPVPEALTIERFAQLAGFDLETAKAAKAALAQVIQDETKVTPPADFADKLAANLAELKTPGAVAAAQQLIYNGSRKSANRVGSRLAAGQSRLMELEAVQLRTAAKLAKFTTDPKDWKAIDKDIKEKIVESFEQILKAKDSFGDTEVQMAEVAALMDKALTNADARLEFDKNAQDIFAKANIEGVTLHSMLRELMTLNSDDPYYKYRIDFNWDSRRIYDTVVSYVAEKPDSALAELTTLEKRGRVRGTAILASIIKYARDNELAIELARAATIKGDAQTKLLLEFQSYMRDASDKKLEELTTLLWEQKELPTNRIIQKALNARDKYIKASDDIAVLKQELAAMRVLSGVFQQAKKVSEDVLGSQNEIYTHHPEAVFAHPTSIEDKIEDIYSSPRVKKVGERSNAELRQVIQDVREYLDANRDRPESKGDLFNRLQRQNTAMLQAISVSDKVRNARSGLLGALIEGTAGLFRTVGSPSGDRVAARITKYSSVLEVLRNTAKRISSDYERSAAAFRKAAGGISDTEFLENFFTEASNLAQVLNADREEIHARIDERFSANEATKEAWAKPGAKKAFWAFLDSVERSAEGAQKMQADHGADLVEDPTTGGYRKQIRRGYLTFPQHTNATLKTWASAVPIQFSADEDKGNIFTTYKLAANAAELRAGMAKFLGKDGWNIFMAPLLGNDLKGVKGPTHADGTNYNLSTSRAKTLVALSGGDFFRFAELAYKDTPNSTQTLNEYTNTLIEEVGKVWKQVATHAVDKATVESLRVNPGIPNIGIDARATQTWPIGWKAPMQFNEDGMRRFTAGVAGVSAFGRDMGETLLDIGAMDKDIDRRIAEIKAKYNKPGVSEREQMTDWNLPKRALVAAGVSSSDWQQLNALENYKKVKWSERITRSLNPDTTLGLNDKLSMEFWSTYVMNLTAGFRSALKNPVSGLNQFALAGEFSADSVKDTLGNYGQLFKQTAASVAQMLPFVDPMRSDTNMQAMYEMGVYDGVTDTNLSDSLKGGLSSTGEHHPVVTFLRRAKEVYKDTRLGFSKGKRGVAVRAFDWFNWSQLTTQLGAVSNNLSIYYEIVQRMADYGRSGGSLLVTPNAKQIGLRGSEVRYNNMMNAWTESGGSDILSLAAELAQNPAMTELEVKKRLVPTINKIVSDRISASSSISANPAWVNSSRAGRIAGTFLGWSLRQGGAIAKPFVDAQTNQVSAATLMRGAGMVALGMLPGVLAYSMLLDMFDDMTERKRDKVELRLNSQQSKDNFVQSLVEAIQDVGVFSLPGDLATTLVSAYQGTGNKGPSFSLDNRLVAVSTFNNFTKLFRDLMVYGPQNMVLSTSGLQAIQAMGGTAWLSNLETLNRMTGADVGGILATYGERQDRVSINNYIREAGRIEGLPVRSFSGSGSTNPPAPMSPWIAEMQLAALTRDEARFDKAKAQAYQLALKDSPNPKEAWTKVAKRYASKHPLRGAFEDRITQMEIQQVVDRIEVMHPGKSKMVQEALVDFNRFGMRVPLFRPVLGAKPSAASVKRGQEIRDKKNQSWF